MEIITHEMYPSDINDDYIDYTCPVIGCGCIKRQYLNEVKVETIQAAADPTVLHKASAGKLRFGVSFVMPTRFTES